MSAASVQRLVAEVDYFQHRSLVAALGDGLAATWLRRARAFEAALPREGDFTGRATPDEVYARALRIAAVIKACRHRASLGLGPDDLELLDVVLEEVAA